MSQEILIVGAGHAAGQLVASLMQRQFDGHVTLVGDEAWLPYQRPPLSKKFLAGELAADRLLVKPPSFYERPEISFHPEVRIGSIDRDRRLAHAEDGRSFAYDTLVLALGASPRRLPLAGADLDGIFYLRTIVDVERIRAALEAAGTLSIIGAGYIGLEVAAVAAGLGVRVTVIEALDRVMSRVVSAEVSAVYEKVHRDHGVELLLSTNVDAFVGDGHVAGVQLDDGRQVDADAVLIGIGAVPNMDLAAAAGLDVDDGILVDDRCRTGDPRIFAIGDCTRHPNPLLGVELRLESVHNAIEQAKTAAANICGEEASYADVPWFWSDQYDLKLQIAGLSQGYDRVILRGETDPPSFACLYLREGRLIAVDAVNSARDFMQSKPLIAAQAIIDPALLADDSVALRDMEYEAGR